MTNKVNVGDKIPSFTAKDQDDFDFESEDLIGSPFVLYFYPKDDTPGCTKEACSFRDNMEHLDELDAIVMGVSPDNATSHNKFIQKHNLNFTLLCDEDMGIAQKFGVIQEKEVNGKKIPSIQRTTFVIDSKGIVRWIERSVNIDGHVDRVVEALKKLTQPA